MTAFIDTIYTTLQKHPYVHIPFPIGSEIINDAVAAFFKFLQEPNVIKNHIDFRLDTTHRRGDVGFKHRDANDHMYNDNKDFFHFHPAIFKKYSEFLKENPAVNDFLIKANPIWDLAYKTSSEILRSFDQRFPGSWNKVFGTEKDIHILVRFLKYDWQESGKYLAKPHFDAGSFTLAIAESSPGLRIGRGPKDLQLVDHKEGHAIFMIASNFKKVMDTDQVTPGWHDVIQLDSTLIGKPYARWAVVAFIEAQGVEALPRTETRKWYTEDMI